MWNFKRDVCDSQGKDSSSRNSYSLAFKLGLSAFAVSVGTVAGYYFLSTEEENEQNHIASTTTGLTSQASTTLAHNDFSASDLTVAAIGALKSGMMLAGLALKALQGAKESTTQNGHVYLRGAKPDEYLEEDNLISEWEEKNNEEDFEGALEKQAELFALAEKEAENRQDNQVLEAPRSRALAIEDDFYTFRGKTYYDLHPSNATVNVKEVSEIRPLGCGLTQIQNDIVANPSWNDCIQFDLHPYQKFHFSMTYWVGCNLVTDIIPQTDGNDYYFQMCGVAIGLDQIKNSNIPEINFIKEATSSTFGDRALTYTPGPLERGYFGSEFMYALKTKCGITNGIAVTDDRECEIDKGVFRLYITFFLPNYTPFSPNYPTFNINAFDEGQDAPLVINSYVGGARYVLGCLPEGMEDFSHCPANVIQIGDLNVGDIENFKFTIKKFDSSSKTFSSVPPGVEVKRNEKMLEFNSIAYNGEQGKRDIIQFCVSDQLDEVYGRTREGVKTEEACFAFIWNVKNRAPVLIGSAESPGIGYTGELFTQTVVPSVTASDVDGDVLAFDKLLHCQSSAEDDPCDLPLPQGINLQKGNSKWNWMPTKDQRGIYYFAEQICDPFEACVHAPPFEQVIGNRPAVFGAVPPGQMQSLSSACFNAPPGALRDPEEDALNITARLLDTDSTLSWEAKLLPFQNSFQLCIDSGRTAGNFYFEIEAVDTPPSEIIAPPGHQTLIWNLKVSAAAPKVLATPSEILVNKTVGELFEWNPLYPLPGSTIGQQSYWDDPSRPLGDNSQLSVENVVGLPFQSFVGGGTQGFRFETDRRIVSGIVGQCHTGSYPITVSVRNAEGSVSTAATRLVYPETAPTVSVKRSVIQSQVGEMASFEVIAAQSQQACQLRFEKTQGPNWVEINKNTGQITLLGAPSGAQGNAGSQDYPVSFQVCHQGSANSLCNEGQFKIQILNQPLIPATLQINGRPLDLAKGLEMGTQLLAPVQLNLQGLAKDQDLIADDVHVIAELPPFCSGSQDQSTAFCSPKAGEQGSYQVKVRLSDGHGSELSRSFAIKVLNFAPQLEKLANLEVAHDETKRVSVVARDDNGEEDIVTLSVELGGDSATCGTEKVANNRVDITCKGLEAGGQANLQAKVTDTQGTLTLEQYAIVFKAMPEESWREQLTISSTALGTLLVLGLTCGRALYVARKRKSQLNKQQAKIERLFPKSVRNSIWQLKEYTLHSPVSRQVMETIAFCNIETSSTAFTAIEKAHNYLLSSGKYWVGLQTSKLKDNQELLSTVFNTLTSLLKTDHLKTHESLIFLLCKAYVALLWEQALNAPLEFAFFGADLGIENFVEKLIQPLRRLNRKAKWSFEALEKIRVTMESLSSILGFSVLYGRSIKFALGTALEHKPAHALFSVSSKLELIQVLEALKVKAIDNQTYALSEQINVVLAQLRMIQDSLKYEHQIRYRQSFWGWLTANFTREGIKALIEQNHYLIAENPGPELWLMEIYQSLAKNDLETLEALIKLFPNQRINISKYAQGVMLLVKCLSAHIEQLKERLLVSPEQLEAALHASSYFQRCSQLLIEFIQKNVSGDLPERYIVRDVLQQAKQTLEKVKDGTKALEGIFNQLDARLDDFEGESNRLCGALRDIFVRWGHSLCHTSLKEDANGLNLPPLTHVTSDLLGASIRQSSGWHTNPLHPSSRTITDSSRIIRSGSSKKKAVTSTSPLFSKDRSRTLSLSDTVSECSSHSTTASHSPNPRSERLGQRSRELHSATCQNLWQHPISALTHSAPSPHEESKTLG